MNYFIGVVNMQGKHFLQALIRGYLVRKQTTAALNLYYIKFLWVRFIEIYLIRLAL